MRVGSTILFSKGTCIQSYQWKKFRPLGSLQGVLDSLEEYQCDEASIIRPVRANDSFLNFSQDIKHISSLKTMTPLCFGGGIRSIKHLNLLSNLPIERIILSSAFLNKDYDLINAAKDLFGQQAIICFLPISHKDENIFVYYPLKERYVPLGNLDVSFIDKFANEIILYDILHEGINNSFDWSILSKVPFKSKKLIISGGVGEKSLSTAKTKDIASVHIDNRVLHKEYSIKGYKNG